MDFKARIAVFGGRDINKEIYEDTVTIGKLLAKENYLVFCGGGEGVMEAICKGVSCENGTSIGILKGDSTAEGNKYLTIPFVTNMGITRNALLPLNADVAIAISGNHGTLSEIAYALQLKVPVIGYKTWDIPGVIAINSVNEIINRIKEHLGIQKK
jgi:uncharacterized protein (TIGR00725 family)